MALLDNGIAYSDGLTQEIIKQNENSILLRRKRIVHQCNDQPAMNQTQKEQFIASLGGSSIPSGILIYPNSFKSKR